MTRQQHMRHEQTREYFYENKGLEKYQDIFLILN